MKKNVLFSAAAVCGIAFSLTACISSKPPAAISKNSYSTIQADEHQTLPPDLKYLTLAEAQDIAVQNNPSFRQAYFAIVAARAQYYAAYTYYLPTVSTYARFKQAHNEYLQADAGVNTTAFSSTVGLNVQLTVFDSFVREMNIIGARHSWKQTVEAENDARRLLLLNVATAYNNVLLAAAQIRIADANMKFQWQLLKETELKFAVGASPLSDVLNFKTKYNSAENDLYSAQYSYVVSKYALAALMGLTEGDIPSAVRFPDMPSADGEMLSDINVYLDTALANRPDLKGAREAVEVARYSYYSSIANFGPTVNFNFGIETGNYNNYTHNLGTTNRYDQYNWNWGFDISWTLFAGGRRYLAMRQQEALLTKADYAAEAQWITVIQEVRTAYDNYVTSLKQVKLNQKNLEIVRKMRDLVNEEYIAGSKGITRLNEAQNDLVNAETKLAYAVINMHNAMAQLLAATDSI